MFIIMNAAKAHGTTIANIFVDTVNAENRFKLAIRNESRMKQNAAVIQLLIFGKQKTERVCSREDDFHAAGCENIRNQGSSLDKVLHQRHFIKENIFHSLRF